MHRHLRQISLLREYRTYLLVGLSAAALVMSACGTTSVPTAIAPVEPGALETAVPTSEQMTAATSPPATPTSAPQSGCPIPPGSPPQPDLSAPFNWALELQDYLNNGGLIEPLAESLSSQPGPDGSTAGVVRRDLTGDGFEDLAVVLYGDQQDIDPSGSLLIFRCDKDRYRLAYSSAPGQNLGPPVLVTVQDLNADGVPELLFTRQSCGAHTCFKQVEILRWDRSAFVNLFEGRSDDLPSPSLEIAGPQNDGSYHIEITAQGISSAGAGPYRQFTREWQWSKEESKFVLAGEQLAPPSFRIHLLHDADDAASAGNFDAALLMYQRVREDGRLDDWIKGETGYAELAAFAAYRQMTMYTVMGRLEEASQAVGFLQEAVPEGSPGYGMRLLAENYWGAFSQAQDLSAACASAQRFADQHAAEVLEPLQYGYANRIYTAADVCPPTQ